MKGKVKENCSKIKEDGRENQGEWWGKSRGMVG